MANQCPICSKRFTSDNELKDHTGTNDTALRHAHVCRKCDRKFCSQEAMERHRNAPSHDHMFSCDVCKRLFGSKQAVADHNKSRTHARILSRSKFTNGFTVSATSTTENESSLHSNPPALTTPSVSIHDFTRGGSNTKDDDGDDGDDGDAFADHSQVDWDDDQDWALCDKDCGWCGHCADGVDY